MHKCFFLNSNFYASFGIQFFATYQCIEHRSPVCSISKTVLKDESFECTFKFGQSIKEKQNFRGVDRAMNIKPTPVLRDDIKIMQSCLIPLLKNLNEVFKSGTGRLGQRQPILNETRRMLLTWKHDLGWEKRFPLWSYKGAQIILHATHLHAINTPFGVPHVILKFYWLKNVRMCK